MKDEARPRAQFQRVAQVIRERIGEGAYPVGSRLPSIAVLATELGSSHMTIKQALSTLSDEGVIASRRGVPAEVIATPSFDHPASVAERLARVEEVVSSLEARVSAIEGHAADSSRPRPSSP